MKKSNLFLVLMMALIVMSCSKDETTMSILQESNAIEFGTYVGRDAQTRASVTDLAALQVADVGFGVFAHYTGTTDYATPTTTPNFMYNQQVKFADSKWGYTPVKYWPNNTGDLVSFFAYAPYGNTNIAVATAAATAAAGDPTLTFTVNGTVKDQADLVWGVNETDGLPFLNQTKQSITGDIKFTFKHALARIGFNVEALVDQVNGNETGAADSETTTGTIAAGTQIVVRKVELIGNFYSSGTLNLNNAAAHVPLWEGVAGTEDRIFKLEAGLTEGTSVNFESQDKIGTSGNETLGQLVTSATAKQKLNNDASYLMIIPQKFFNLPDSTKIKIRVTYDVITTDGNLNTGQSKVTNVITSTPFAFDFVGGNAYTFNLHLGMTSVKFDATVSDWGEETGTVVNVPINN